jgi:hypothetical protein
VKLNEDKRGWLAQFTISWSVVSELHNMWQCFWSLWNPECWPGGRSTFR